MSNKSSKLLAIILILAVAALFVTGCGKSGSRFENQLPSISITSFEGWSDDNVPSNIDTTQVEFTFQQKIFWHANDPDGVITGYAFRVLDENRQPIATPGYQYIARAEDGLIPDEMLSTLGDGWVIHYLPSADQSMPLDDPETDRSIWTNQKYAVINFPAADENGEPTPTLSFFEVVAIDNRGAVTPVPAWRKFRTNSVKPICNVSTTKGNPDGGDVGSGITLRFTMHYPSNAGMIVDAIPFKYEFRMMKVYDDSGEIVPGSMTEWISTEGQERINEYKLTRRTTPALSYDYENGNTNTTTKIEARVTDLAGVVSDVETTDPVLFKVKPGFRPMTQLYSKKILALGRNHFEDRHDDTTPEELPYSIDDGQQHFAAPLFKNMQNRFTVVYSENLKVYVRWGWWGEYGKEESTGTITYPLDDPYIKKVDTVLSEPNPEIGYGGGENYYGEITHFDVRYDGQPYYFPPFAESIHTDDDGTQWLRLPLYSPLRQSIVLTGNQLTPGEHVFTVRCVDSQDEVSLYPAELVFTVEPYKSPSQRNGLLIIDDDTDNQNLSPEAIVNNKYAQMSGDIENVDFVKYNGTEEGNRTYRDIRNRHLAFSDLQNYKMVIYHADNPAQGGSIENEIDGLSLYLRNGGALVISHTSQFASKSTTISTKRGFTLLNLLGLPEQPTMVAGPSNPAQGPFFLTAVGMSGYPNLDLQYSNHPSGNGNNSFSQAVEYFHGFSSVAYHKLLGGVPNITGEAIYSYGCKPIDYVAYPPSEEQFNNLNGKIVGTRKINENGSRAYIFTFPLSYMEETEAKVMINKIWSELL
nr:hypothetical protein [Candidatus Cloacimonadota bacterium]